MANDKFFNKLFPNLMIIFNFVSLCIIFFIEDFGEEFKQAVKWCKTNKTPWDSEFDDIWFGDEHVHFHSLTFFSFSNILNLVFKHE